MFLWAKIYILYFLIKLVFSWIIRDLLLTSLSDRSISTIIPTSFDSVLEHPDKRKELWNSLFKSCLIQILTGWADASIWHKRVTVFLKSQMHPDVILEILNNIMWTMVLLVWWRVIKSHFWNNSRILVFQKLHCALPFKT